MAVKYLQEGSERTHILTRQHFRPLICFCFGQNNETFINSELRLRFLNNCRFCFLKSGRLNLENRDGTIRVRVF